FPRLPFVVILSADRGLTSPQRRPRQLHGTSRRTPAAVSKQRSMPGRPVDVGAELAFDRVLVAGGSAFTRAGRAGRTTFGGTGATDAAARADDGTPIALAPGS